jgi:hypothetical protein
MTNIIDKAKAYKNLAVNSKDWHRDNKLKNKDK